MWLRESYIFCKDKRRLVWIGRERFFFLASCGSNAWNESPSELCDQRVLEWLMRQCRCVCVYREDESMEIWDFFTHLISTSMQVPDLNQLLNLVDRMKQVGDVVNVFISRHGDLSVQVSTTVISLGAEFRRLVVIGEQTNAPSEDQNLSAQTRSSRSISRGDGQSVQVSVKHFAKSLQCHLARPDCAFYGIAPQGSCLTVIFQFFIPGSRETDKSISLHCRLPVLDPGSG